MFFLALCVIVWIIEFEFTSYEVNHIDEIMNIPISPSVSFGQLSLTVDAFPGESFGLAWGWLSEISGG